MALFRSSDLILQDENPRTVVRREGHKKSRGPIVNEKETSSDNSGRLEGRRTKEEPILYRSEGTAPRTMRPGKRGGDVPKGGIWGVSPLKTYLSRKREEEDHIYNGNSGKKKILHCRLEKGKKKEERR